MKDVSYVIGSENISKKVLPPFSDEAVEFCADLSKELLKSKEIREYPDISALAFWCRKNNVEDMKKNYEDSIHRLGRGLCFHIAPGNIPVNFAFTYLFGVLSGCANIVRLPSKDFPQIDVLCRIIGSVLERHKTIKDMTAFVRYPADNNITADFCLKADARVIWGGDATVSSIRALPTHPKCVDVCFADRYSFAVIDGNEILSADEEIIARLVSDFYNDTYLMDQNACSSPKLIAWLNDSQKGRERFWNSVYEYTKKKYMLQPAIAVEKYMQACRDAINTDGQAKVNVNTNLLYRVDLSDYNGDMTAMSGKGGYFYEKAINSLTDLSEIVTQRYQTVTSFGVDREMIRNWVISSGLLGIDRIVPIGKAMDIGIVWDGYDLIRSLSRNISID